jgi:hypothetical protein
VDLANMMAAELAAPLRCTTSTTLLEWLKALDEQISKNDASNISGAWTVSSGQIPCRF